MKSFMEIWNELEVEPFDEDENGIMVLAEDWFIFEKGTSREDIWMTLEDLYGVCIGDLL